MPTYSLSSQVFYDSIKGCYRKVITTNIEPTGPLKNYIKRTYAPKLSPFKEQNICCPKTRCLYIILSITNSHEYMCIDEIPDLFSYLLANGYTIDSNLTKIMQDSNVKMDNDLICFITYP